MALKLTRGEIAGRQSSRLVDDVDQHIGAILTECLADGIVDQGFGKGPVGIPEFLRFGDINLLSVGSIAINFIFLEPITAPKPPRPQERILDPGSLMEMLAAAIFISPAGPMEMTPNFSPRRLLRVWTTS